MRKPYKDGGGVTWQPAEHWVSPQEAIELLTKQRDGLLTALREIADYRNNDAQLRALRIARTAIEEYGTIKEMR